MTRRNAIRAFLATYPDAEVELVMWELAMWEDITVAEAVVRARAVASRYTVRRAEAEESAWHAKYAAYLSS